MNQHTIKKHKRNAKGSSEGAIPMMSIKMSSILITSFQER